MVMGDFERDAQMLVLGGGPGGYAAAFRAADLGLDTVLVDADGRLGGECLFRGCIPSKALLGVAALIGDAARAKEFGIEFTAPAIHLDALRAWKDGVIDRLAGGLEALCRARGVELVRGRAVFDEPRTVRVEGGGRIRFRHAIVATGSRPATLPGLGLESPRVMDSDAALALSEIPRSLLVIGGGYIGLELGTVYAALGSEVTLVELTDGLLPGVDRDLVAPVARRAGELFKAVWVGTKVTGMTEERGGIEVRFDGGIEPSRQTFERVLVAVGRRPNSDGLGLERTGVTVDERGFIVVDERRQSADPRIYAIGDVAGEPMLAHKAMREGKVAAEAIAGQPSAFDNRAVPAVVFTDPEIAWCGLTEEEARRSGQPVRVVRFPWSASGRALALARSEGLTKLVVDAERGLVIGAGIVGAHAGELIAEATLAVETAATAEDLAATIHAHPTLAETIMEAAEVFLGGATHLKPRR